MLILIITTFPQTDVEADTKTVVPTNSLEGVEAGTKAEAFSLDRSSKPNDITVDNDPSEGPKDRADINLTTIFNVNNIDPERVVLTEYMTPEAETLSKVISPGKESKKATEKVTKATKKAKKGKNNVRVKDVSTNKTNDKNINKKDTSMGKNITNIDTEVKTISINNPTDNETKIDTTKVIKGTKNKNKKDTTKGINITNIETEGKTIPITTPADNETKIDTTEVRKETKKAKPKQKLGEKEEEKIAK